MFSLSKFIAIVNLSQSVLHGCFGRNSAPVVPSLSVRKYCSIMWNSCENAVCSICEFKRFFAFKAVKYERLLNTLKIQGCVGDGLFGHLRWHISLVLYFVTLKIFVIKEVVIAEIFTFLDSVTNALEGNDHCQNFFYLECRVCLCHCCFDSSFFDVNNVTCFGSSLAIVLKRSIFFECDCDSIGLNDNS